MSKFAEFSLTPAVLKVLPLLGYEKPTPIQEQSIPVLLQGEDLLAQAQTGTGKTAAFALPILSQLNLTAHQPQALILAPTRELTIQVAEAFHEYAKFCEGFHVLPIYGGQDYQPQLRGLKRGAQVIVGTPGRIMDHLRRGSLTLTQLKIVVLDEADEMLKMGFIEDVKWILEQIPTEHQTALFSATMPSSIREIAKQYLHKPKFIHIKPSEASIKSIQQFFTIVSKENKLEALTRFLEIENFNAVIIFTRTKNTSAELAEKLKARGYAAAAINGDMSQNLREKVIQNLKQGSLDIIVATEVAARGLDIERVSYVISYDIPYDVDSYTHRIGRTGRAGRTGKALVFITHRERYLLKAIERATKQEIKEIQLPSLIQIKEKRLKNLIEKISKILIQENLNDYRDFIKSILAAGEWDAMDVACAIAFLAQKQIKLENVQIDTLTKTNFPAQKQKHFKKSEYSDQRKPHFRKESNFSKKEKNWQKPHRRKNTKYQENSPDKPRDQQNFKSQDRFKGKLNLKSRNKSESNSGFKSRGKFEENQGFKRKKKKR